MFCNKCGNELAPGARFCNICGTPVTANPEPQQAPNYQQAPYQQPAPAPKPANPMFTNFVGTLKGFFSKDCVKTVGKAAKSTGMEWLLFLAACATVYSIALGANVCSMLGDFVEYFETSPFITLFFIGMLFAGITFFLMSLGVFVSMKIMKKDVALTNVFNLVGAASLTLAAVYATNIIMGFIWPPLVLIFSFVGIIAFAVQLYAGMQKLAKFDSSPFFAYAIVWLAVIVTFILTVYILGDVLFKDFLEELGSAFIRMIM